MAYTPIWEQPTSGPQLPFNPMTLLMGTALGGIPGAVLGAFLGGIPESNVEPYISPGDIPLTSEQMAMIQALAGGGTMMSETGLEALFQAAPEAMRPFLSASMEQTAAMNALSEQRYNDWMDYQNRGRQGASDVLASVGRLF